MTQANTQPTQAGSGRGAGQGSFFGSGPSEGASGESLVVLNPEDSFGFFIVRDNRSFLKASIREWGDKAEFCFGPKSKDTFKNGKLSITGETTFKKTHHLNHAVEMSFPSPNTLAWHCTVTAGDGGVSFTHLALVCDFDPKQKGEMIMTCSDGSKKELKFPLKGGNCDNVTKIAFRDQGKDQGELTLGAPVSVLMWPTDMHLSLAGDGWGKPSEVMAAGAQKSFSITFTLPEKISVAAPDHFIKPMADASWFVFKPKTPMEKAESVIAMDDWLDKPAGAKHGGVRSVGDHFEFEDGTPVKFWGTQFAYGNNAPSHAEAERAAAFYARFGVNCIRCGPGTNPPYMGLGDKDDATKYDPKLLDQCDYLLNQLASHGIYYRFCLTWNFHIGPKNKHQVLDYDELMNFADSVSNTKGSGTVSLINFAEDVQDLLIGKVVNLLKHTNPYSGKTYAKDPALCSIEMQNEDDIFWWTTNAAFRQCPTYAKKLTQRFAAWLKKRYGSQSALEKAWGPRLNRGESLAAGNFKFEMSAGALNGARGNPRLLDNALFLHEEQNAFYGKFAKAMRGAGYKGPVFGSNWQAPEMLLHYYNLKSDAKVGLIDRHNYFGGKIFDTMMSNPGGGMLSAGLQQVSNRPFGLSEWVHVYPTCYGAEGPPLIAAYGMGLQGWDACYENQSHTSPLVYPVASWLPWGVWEVDTPTQLGQYPLVARMIYRDDVKEAKVISVRKVSETELEQGNINFKEDYQQQGDVKSFSGGVPPAALAAGRCLVQFTEKPELSTFPDMSKYQAGTVVTSSTRQLKWDSAGKGFFTIDTPGTKGVVGFAQGKAQELGNVTITSQSPYASILLTAKDKTSSLNNGSTAILSLISRQCNTGFTYSALDDAIIKNGKAPVLLEPVQADIAVKGRKIHAVNVLDQVGVRTGETVRVQDGVFHIDTGKDKTMYYEIIFDSVR